MSMGNLAVLKSWAPGRSPSTRAPLYAAFDQCGSVYDDCRAPPAEAGEAERVFDGGQMRLAQLLDARGPYPLPDHNCCAA